MFVSLADLVDGSKSEDLPDTLELTSEELDAFWEVWTLWRATDRRFLPSQLLAEPRRPLLVMIELDGAYALIERQLAKQEAAKQEKIAQWRTMRT